MKRTQLVAATGTVLLLALALLLSTAPARSQGASAHDLPGGGVLATIDVHAGFVMDPYVLPIAGGGATEAAQISDACTGYVDVQPNVILNWSGEVETLSVFLYSDLDPVLLVQTPDGEVLCNDDAHGTTTDPLITLEAPVEGQYRIHVGALAQNEPVFGFLGLTEEPLDETELDDLDLTPMLDRQDPPEPAPPPDVTAGDLLHREPSLFGLATLGPDFQPVDESVSGGGHIEAFYFEEDQLLCAGYVGDYPSYSFIWEGEPQPLRVLFAGETDSALFAVTPDGSILCHDNIDSENVNPALHIENVQDGEYDIYIAGHQPGHIVVGELTLTPDATALPASLPAMHPGGDDRP